MGCAQFRFLSEDELLLVSGGLTAAEEAEREALRRQQEQNRPVEEVVVTGSRSLPPSNAYHLSYAEYANLASKTYTYEVNAGNQFVGGKAGYQTGSIPPMSEYLNYMQGQKRTDSGCKTCHY